jgi:hypothetical protein
VSATGAEAEHGARALEHGDPGRLQQPGDVVLAVALVIVVAEYGDHGYAEVAELGGDDFGLLDGAVLGQVAGQQQASALAPISSRCGLILPRTSGPRCTSPTAATRITPALLRGWRQHLGHGHFIPYR